MALSGAGKKYARLILIVAIVVAADQISKMIVIDLVPLYGRIPILPGFFDITHIYNPGGAFGFLADYSDQLRQVLFVAAALLAIGLVFYFYAHTPSTHPFLSLALCLVLGGAVGNLIDRFRLGKVVDFLDVYVNDLHWPAFNVADSAISVGIAIFVYHLVFNKMPD